MNKIRVLIVDDSAVMRHVINKAITKDPNIEVVGSINSGIYAINAIERLKPDIVTLDIEMPEMDGIQVLTAIRKIHLQLPVIMCSSLTLNGAEVTMRALSLGASDYVTKPGGQKQSYETMGAELIFKIKGLVKKEPISAHHKEQSNPRPLSKHPKPIKILVIGISTGGPNALNSLIPKLPTDFPVPIMIVQHMPPIFTNILAVNLAKISQIPVKEAKEGDEIRAGEVLIAPGDYHMTINPDKHRYLVRLNQDPKENFCRPAADVLFRSAAQIFGAHTLALIMTGMGRDGMLGCKEIRSKGGRVMIQDESSSVVWGMPGAVAQEGLADEICPLDSLAKSIQSCIEQANGSDL